MSKRHLVVIFAAVFLSIAVVLMLSFTVKKFASKAESDRQAQEMEEYVQRLGDLDDYMVYYIGEPSPEVVANIKNLTVIPAGMMNRNTLPIYWSDIHFIEKDEDDNIINEVEPRDYASYMLIYVGADVTLTDDQLELLRNCNIDNDVPLIIEGEANINAYREVIFMGPHELGEHSTSMFTPWGRPQDNIIAEDVVTGSPSGFVNALIDVILSNAEQMDIYREESLVLVETESTTTTEISAETSDESEISESTDEA